MGNSRRYFNSYEWRNALAYKTGEAPHIGDRVRNKLGQEGTVRSVQQGVADISEDKLTIKWDDGIVDIDGYSAGEHALVSRSSDRK